MVELQVASNGMGARRPREEEGRGHERAGGGGCGVVVGRGRRRISRGVGALEGGCGVPQEEKGSGSEGGIEGGAYRAAVGRTRQRTKGGRFGRKKRKEKKKRKK